MICWFYCNEEIPFILRKAKQDTENKAETLLDVFKETACFKVFLAPILMFSRRSVLASGKLNMSDDESCLLYREGDDSEIEESSLSSDEDNYGQERLPEEEEDWDVG